MQRIERAAEISVARGCGFACIAIGTMMAGLSSEMRLACQAGGYATLMACLILVMKAMAAERLNYKSTEVWLILRPEDRPASEVAQRVIGGTLREVYFRFALRAAFIAAFLLIVAVLLSAMTQRAA